MAELSFTVVDVVPEPYAAAPNLLARIRVEETTGERVHALALRAQIRIEPQRRRYDDTEERALLDLFGDRTRFAETLRPFAWLHASTVAQGFTGSTEIELPLPCTYDFEVSGTTYLHALRDGEIPLLFLFSGTVFTRGHDRVLRRPGAVGPRGAVPAAGRRLARPDGDATSRAPSGCACGGTPSRRSRTTGTSAASPPGTTPSPRCSPRCGPGG